MHYDPSQGRAYNHGLNLGLRLGDLALGARLRIARVGMNPLPYHRMLIDIINGVRDGANAGYRGALHPSRIHSHG